MKDHPAFKFLFVAVFLGIFAAVNGCISNDPRTGSHDMARLVVIDGQYNTAHITFTLNKGDTEAKNEGGGQVAPIGDEALKTAGKTAAALGSGGLSTIPQAAAKIAEDKAPLSPLP